MSKILFLLLVVLGLLLVSVIGSEDIATEESRAYKIKPTTQKVIPKTIDYNRFNAPSKIDKSSSKEKDEKNFASVDPIGIKKEDLVNKKNPKKKNKLEKTQDKLPTAKVNSVELEEVNDMVLNIGSFPNLAEEIVTAYLEKFKETTEEQFRVIIKRGDKNFTVSLKYEPAIGINNKREILKLMRSISLELNDMLRALGKKEVPIPDSLDVIMRIAPQQSK